MSDKPEVIRVLLESSNKDAYDDIVVTGNPDDIFAGAYDTKVPLIRLTDHEASRAADKKRMAGLEAALRTAKELADFWINQSSKPGMTETEYSVWLALGHQSKAMDAIRVALAQQGKEGGA